MCTYILALLATTAIDAEMVGLVMWLLPSSADVHPN